MRLILCATVAALALASPGVAEPFEGLRPGMSRDDAKRILGPTASEEPIDGGVYILVRRPDGRIVSVDVCTRSGRNDVNTVSEHFGRSVEDFVAEVLALRTSLGDPQLKVRADSIANGHRMAQVQAQWPMPGGYREVALLGTGPVQQVLRTLSTPCR